MGVITYFNSNLNGGEICETVTITAQVCELDL